MAAAFIVTFFQLGVLMGLLLAGGQTESQLYRQGQQAMADGDYSRAIQALREVARLSGKSAPVLLQLGVCYYQTGEYDDAAASLRLALQVQPNLAPAKAFLGLSEAGIGHTPSAG